MRKKSKSEISTIQEEIWQECKRIVDEQFGINCYTCPAKNLQGRNKQLGHVIWPKASLGAYLKYDLRLLRNQCFSCNINKSGMNTEGYKRMLREEGKEYMEQLEKDRNVTVKAIDHYRQLLAYYKTVRL